MFGPSKILQFLPLYIFLLFPWFVFLLFFNLTIFFLWLNVYLPAWTMSGYHSLVWKLPLQVFPCPYCFVLFLLFTQPQRPYLPCPLHLVVIISCFLALLPFSLWNECGHYWYSPCFTMPVMFSLCCWLTVVPCCHSPHNSFFSLIYLLCCYYFILPSSPTVHSPP